MRFLSLCVVACLVLALSSGSRDAEHGARATKAKRMVHGVYNPVFDKEALLGSRHTKELEALPEEVRRKRLRILAKSHDANHNDVIEESELKDWLMQSFRMLDSEEAIEKFREQDVNEDDKLSLDEILVKQLGHSEKDLVDMKLRGNEDDLETVQAAEEDRIRFKAADLNNDGFLDEAEHFAFFQPYDYPHMHAAELARVMKDTDTDKDGIVSRAEFVDEEDENEKDGDAAEFEKLDKNKDGQLTQEELKGWALPDNEDVAKEELEHLLKEVDENKDGHLSIDEIVDKEDEFMQSSTTDYGRNLHFVKEEL